MGKEEVQETDDNNYEEHHTKYNGLWGEILSQLKNRLVYSRRSKNMTCIYMDTAGLPGQEMERRK